MKPRPIIMTSNEVRAILDGRKTQKRVPVRICDAPIAAPAAAKMSRQHGIPRDAVNVRLLGHRLKCDAPAGSATVSVRVDCPFSESYRDDLWVRESFAHIETSPGDFTPPAFGYGLNGVRSCDRGGEGRPGCFFRFIYEATESAESSKGVTWRCPIFMPLWASRIFLKTEMIRAQRIWDISHADAAAEGFNTHSIAKEWDENHTKYSWASNPWVWVIDFSVDLVIGPKESRGA